MKRKSDKLDVGEDAWREAVAREAIIRPLAGAGRLSPTEVKTACRALGLRRARLYALIERYRSEPVTSSMLAAKPGPARGARRLADDVEALIEEAIRDYYLKRQKPSVSALHDHIRQLCRTRSVAAPSRKAIQTRVASIDRRVLVGAREGAKAARDGFKPVVAEYRADHALHIVQIDHTPVDVFVVDAVHRRPIQRPWLTLAIDVASRMVAGFYLSLEAPSAASVALAIHHAVTRKAQWLAVRSVKGDWPVSGLPDVIHLDNAREFRSRALKRGAAEYGVSLVHRPVATPHYGGHIERLIGTMMGTVHLLPGTTFSHVSERGAYEPEKHAAMTLDELERWLALQIVGRYHAEVHGSLLLPPGAAWGDAVAARREPLRFPHDEAQFLYDFLPFEERRIRRDGVRLFGLRYWDDVLSPWAGRTRSPASGQIRSPGSLQSVRRGARRRALAGPLRRSAPSTHHLGRAPDGLERPEGARRALGRRAIDLRHGGGAARTRRDGGYGDEIGAPPGRAEPFGVVGDRGRPKRQARGWRRRGRRAR